MLRFKLKHVSKRAPRWFGSKHSVSRIFHSWDTWIQILTMPKGDNLSPIHSKSLPYTINHYIYSIYTLIYDKLVWPLRGCVISMWRNGRKYKYIMLKKTKKTTHNQHIRSYCLPPIQPPWRRSFQNNVSVSVTHYLSTCPTGNECRLGGWGKYQREISGEMWVIVQIGDSLTRMKMYYHCRVAISKHVVMVTWWGSLIRVVSVLFVCSLGRKPGRPVTRGALLLTWISNYIRYKVWDEITYPIPKLQWLHQ